MKRTIIALLVSFILLSSCVDINNSDLKNAIKEAILVAIEVGYMCRAMEVPLAICKEQQETIIDDWFDIKLTNNEETMKKIIKKRKVSKELAEQLERARQAKGGRKLNPKERWEKNPTSLRASVNAKCYDCCGEESHIGRIGYCQIFDCPLWNVRPYAKNKTKEDCINWVEPSVRAINKDDEEEDPHKV